MSWLQSFAFTLAANNSLSTFESAFEENPDLARTPEIGLHNSSANLIWYLLSFLVVLSLVVLGIRWMAGKTGRIGGRYLKLMESLYLGPNRGIHLIRAANRVFLIGMADRHMELLAEITDPEVIAEAEREASADKEKDGFPSYKDFSFYLQRILRMKNKKPDPTGSSRLQDELTKFKGFRDR
ncbi:MAG TPA: flagellar biosynthetic protein FliO [Bacillota bacterium]